MGLLTAGHPLNWDDTYKVSEYIRLHGIEQFLCTWRRVKDIRDDELRFGDEIECGIFHIDQATKTIKLSIRSAELRFILKSKEQQNSHQLEGATWQPEFGAWMIESTPSRPYTNYASDLLRVERNMVLRRRRLLSVLQENEIAPTVTCFLLLGTSDSIHNPLEFSAPHSQSIYVPDYIINPHPRFAALTENIRSRRTEKVDIQVPLFRDSNTPEYLSEEDYQNNLSNGKYPQGFIRELNTNIHMDCMAFGMGMCCLQVTFQARDVDESRYMYDQLAVLAPIMLAITAATPILKGRLSGYDARWDIISQSVDDRTPAERGLIPENEIESLRNPYLAGEGVRLIHKSRYDSISTYIYHCHGDPKCMRSFEIYNDIPCPVDEVIKQKLRSEGVDENLAHHLAHLFTRDPLVVYEGMIELDDERSTDHFENIQSTNWQTCRWKPPPPRESPDDPHIGWRTEFRPMEVQLTDFENAAFTVFIVLLTRVLLAFNLAVYIPLSKVDENMRRAHQLDAVRKSTFYFRKHVAPPEFDEPSPTASSTSMSTATAATTVPSDSLDSERNHVETSQTSSSAFRKLEPNDGYEEMTIDEIFNGKGEYFPGLIPLVYAYLDYINCDTETYHRINQYLVFISRRAKGELITPATWIRRLVETHPSYQHDSIITQEIAYDVLLAAKNVGEGNSPCPEILGDVLIDRVRKDDAYGQVLAGKLDDVQRSQLLQRLRNRAYLKTRENSPGDDSL